jgi:hypothetical protein
MVANSYRGINPVYHVLLLVPMNEPTQPAGQPDEAKVEQRHEERKPPSLKETEVMGMIAVAERDQDQEVLWEALDLFRRFVAGSEARAVAEATKNSNKFLLMAETSARDWHMKWEKEIANNRELRAQLISLTAYHQDTESVISTLRAQLEESEAERLKLKIFEGEREFDLRAKLATAEEKRVEAQIQRAVFHDAVVLNQTEEAALRTQLAQAEAALREAQADSSFVDWLVDHATYLGGGNGGTFSFTTPLDTEDTRAAFYAAMSQQPGGK